MKPGDSAIELPLGCRCTRDGEVYLAKLFRGFMPMLMALLRGGNALTQACDRHEGNEMKSVFQGSTPFERKLRAGGG